MIRPRIAVTAAVLAAAVGIEAGVEGDVGRVVVGDHRTRAVVGEGRAGCALFLRVPLLGIIGITRGVRAFKTIGGVARRAATGVPRAGGEALLIGCGIHYVRLDR